MKLHFTSKEESLVQGEKNNQKESQKIARFSKRTKAFVFSLVLWVSWQQYLKYQQDMVNTIHEWMDFIVNPETVSLDQKLNALIASNDAVGYKSDYFTSTTSQSKWMIRFLKPGLIKWMDLEWAKSYIAYEKENAWFWKMFAFDFEWGYFPNITFTREDYESFGIPHEILDLRDQQAIDRQKQGKSTQNLNTLPSQEYIGKYYIWLSDWEKKKFLWIMEQYGRGISRMLTDLGIDIVFWPVVDTVPKNTSWNQDVAWNGRSFWSGTDGVGDLIVSYVRWVQSGSGELLPVYKHFIAAGIGSGDTHNGANSVQNIQSKALQEAAPEYIWSQACKLQTNQEINENRSFESFAQIEKEQLDIEEWQQIILKLKKKIHGDKDWLKIHIKNQSRYDRNESILMRQSVWNRLHWLDIKQRILDRKMENLLAHKQWVISTNSSPIWVMTSHVSWYYSWNKNQPVIYDKNAISNISKLGCNEKNSLIITDDLSMDGSDLYLKPLYKKYPQYSRDAIRIYHALSSGNDIVFKQYLHTNWNFVTDGREEIIHEITEMIKNGVDMNNDHVPDLTEVDVSKKYSKFLSILAWLWKIESFHIGNGNEGYMFPENISRLIEDVNSWDIARDIIFSNMIPTVRSWETTEKIDTGWKQWDHAGPITLLLKSIESISKWFFYLLTSDDLTAEKLIVVDKSVQTLFIIDWTSREIITSFPISIGKWTHERDGLYDRRDFWDGKTPVWFYKFTHFKDSKELHQQFWDDYKDYGGSEWWMVVLAWPWSPNIAIHGTLEKITGQQSSGCVRIENTDLETIRSMVPEGALVVITN